MIVIIGGGIVGLATAYQILEKKPKAKVLVLEKENDIAQHQTGHNSGVIHSGLYYKPGSAKAKNCIDGYDMLLKFAEENGIKHDLCGKIVVATKQEQLPILEGLYKRGAENGLNGFKMLKAEELKEHEPHVAGLAGFFVPQTGIINYVDVAKKYAQKIVEKGGQISLNTKVLAINKLTKGSVVKTTNGEFEADLVVNCAGLYSDKIARETETLANDVLITPFRGEYFELKKEKQYLVKNLIYPVPDPNFPFLGVHFTRMIHGGVEAGPNAVLAFKKEGYNKFDIDFKELFETLAWPGFRKVAFKYWQTGLGEMYRSFSKAAFTKALQELVPEIQSSDLLPGHAGVRAQACDRSGGLLDDFAIYQNAYAINVLNAPSPAATSSLAIGDTISKLVIQYHLD